MHHCGACHGVRPLRIAPLVPGIAGLGGKAECARCAHVSFTFLNGRQAFCPVCDNLQPLEIVRSSVPGAGFACCGSCGQLLAALYSEARDPAARQGGSVS